MTSQKQFFTKTSNINIFHITQYFGVKSYKHNQWNLPNILVYISGTFDDFFQGGSQLTSKLDSFQLRQAENLEWHPASSPRYFFSQTIFDLFPGSLHSSVLSNAPRPRAQFAIPAWTNSLLSIPVFPAWRDREEAREGERGTRRRFEKLQERRELLSDDLGIFRSDRNKLIDLPLATSPHISWLSTS